LQKKQIIKSYCEKCGKEITKGSKLCFDCNHVLQMSNSSKPDKEVLIKDLYDLQGNFTKIGDKYGVSDNAVRKWCRKYNLPYKRKDIVSFRKSYII
jgi:transposase-like protein